MTSYELVVRNLSAAAVHQVRVEDLLPPGARYLGGEPSAETADSWLTWKLESLEPGSERRLVVHLLAPGGVDPASSPTRVSFSTSSKSPDRTAFPQLVLTVSGPESVMVGEAVMLQMKLTNIGTGPAVKVVMRNSIPDGLRHKAGAEVESELGTVAPGDSRSFQLEATAVEPGRHINQATATADGAAPATAHTPVTVRPAAPRPTLALEITDLADPLRVGTDATCAIRVLNQGESTASGLRVSVRIPDGLDLIDADGPAAHRREGHNVFFETAPVLEANGVQLYRIRVKGKELGKWSLKVELTAEQLDEPRIGEMTIRVLPPE